MASELIENHKENAEIYYGEDVCKQKTMELLQEISLPKGLMPLEIVEFGRNRSTGFVWIKQKTNTKKEHKFKSINKLVSYDGEITFLAENAHIKKITGVKSKEMFIWINVSDIFIEDTSSSRIFFAIPSGLKAHFPVSAFEPEEEEHKNNDKKKITDDNKNTTTPTPTTTNTTSAATTATSK